MSLPINIEELLSGKIIETERLEFKSGWNPDSIYRAICAFANDFENTGGGYILIGVEEDNDLAKRPVKGIPSEEIALIQKKMVGFNNLIRPVYHPKLSIEKIDNKLILVLWVPGGSYRPYEVPDNVTAGRNSYNYRIRKYQSSVIPDINERNELLNLANQVPFDDRPNTSATIADVSSVLVEDYLKNVKSKLRELVAKSTFDNILGAMELISGPPENCFPRNVSLMLFNNRPDKFFPYSRIEIVHFPDDADSDEFYEIPHITGPVQNQITSALNYLKSNVLKEKIIKVQGESKAVRIWNYPFQALEEAVTNSIYHRDYSVREPVEIRIYSDSISIHNYGGPDRSIRMEAFNSGIIKARRYRNRRLGDFLKELHLTEGKATGIPMIRRSLADNGSPNAGFDTDEMRSYFLIEFKVHPAFLKIEIPEMLLNPSDLDDIERLLSWINENLSDQKTDITETTSGNEESNDVSAIISTKSNEVRTEVNNLINRFIDAVKKNITDKSNEVTGSTGTDVSNEVMKDLSVALSKVLGERTITILAAGFEPLSLDILFKKAGLTKQTKSVNRYLRPLLERDWMKMSEPDNPRSRNQKYYTSMKGMMILKLCNYR